MFLSRDVLRPVACLPAARGAERIGDGVGTATPAAAQVPRLREPEVEEPEPEPESSDDSDSEAASSTTRATSQATSRATTVAREPGTWLPNGRFPSDHMALVIVFDVDERLTPAVHAA